MDDNVIEIMALALPSILTISEAREQIAVAVAALEADGYKITKRDDTMVTVPRKPFKHQGAKAVRSEYKRTGGAVQLSVATANNVWQAMIEAYEAEIADG